MNWWPFLFATKCPYNKGKWARVIIVIEIKKDESE
jgi:hypothetical protein